MQTYTVQAHDKKTTKKHKVFTYVCHLEDLKAFITGDNYDNTTVPGTKSDDLRSYADFMRVCGFFGKQISNSVTYEEFLSVSYVKYFDFSTNFKSAEKHLVPIVRNVELKLVLNFSAALPFEVRMLLLFEHPSTLVIDEKLNVTVTKT